MIHEFTIAGVGSRQTPPDVLKQMAEVSRKLTEQNCIVRSGGATGADAAFLEGALPEKFELYLPKPNHNGLTGSVCDVSPDAIDMALELHPAPGKLSPMAKLLHGRNCHIMLGPDLDKPCDVVLCYTPGGALKGGTAMALRIAKKHNIPVFNFGVDHQTQTVYDFLNEIFELKHSTSLFETVLEF